jgi:para-aminobenzoate synthetase component 1
MSIREFAAKLNEWGAQRIPFLFLVDFELQKPLAYELHDINPEKLLFNLNGFSNIPEGLTAEHKAIDLIKFPQTFRDYRKKYDHVFSRLLFGDSYLTNLTIKTRVRTDYSLKDIFLISQAKYKLLEQNHFLVFSPETFIQIRDGKIFSFPMKGTIDADVPDAREKILSDSKEMAEHVTIVDLIRNDLSEVSDNVQVTRFRYVETITTTNKNLLQVSSEISGELPANYHDHLGDIMSKLLPAGSVSGAPKGKTLEIIRQAERESRGYYTGVVGFYDGKTLDSGVMIRFIENENGSLYYRSGGGITTQSKAETEYQEAIDKVYVPVN